jgi:hypothetical protein
VIGRYACLGKYFTARLLDRIITGDGHVTLQFGRAPIELILQTIGLGGIDFAPGIAAAPPKGFTGKTSVCGLRKGRIGATGLRQRRYDVAMI